MTARIPSVDLDRISSDTTVPAPRLSRRAALQGIGGAGLALAGLTLVGRFAPAASADHMTAPDPGSVVAAHVAAVNAGDLAAILALYADDAIHVALPTADGSAGVCRGKAEFTKWYEQAIKNGDRIELVPDGLRVDGERAVFALRTISGPWTALGLGPLEGTAEIAVADGLIRTHVVMLSPEAVRQLLAAQGVAPTGGPTDAAAMRGGTGALRR